MSDSEQQSPIPELAPGAPDPAPAVKAARPERVVRRGGTPVLLTLVLFAALGGGLYWVWTNPMPHQAEDPAQAQAAAAQIAALAGRLQALEQSQADQKQALQGEIQAQVKEQVEDQLKAQLQDPLRAVTARVETLEKAPLPAPPAGAGDEARQLAELGTRLDALATREQSDAQAIQAVQTQQQKQADIQTPPAAPDHAALDAVAAAAHADAQGQVAALTQRMDEALAQAKAAIDQAAGQQKAAIDSREQADSAARDALAARIEKLEQGEGRVSGQAAKTEQAVRIEQAAIALQSGLPLGELPGAPAPLAAFATRAPPTEAALRAAFPKVADAIRAASRPEAAKTSFLDRALARVEQSVTVRRGDHVIVGDPASGILARAQDDVANGDLAGAVHALGSLQGEAAAAAADWVGQANALLAARAALANLSAHG